MYPNTPKEREWYKKKRYAIPAAFMIFFVAMSFIGAISGSKSSGEAQTLPQPSTSAAALAPTQAAAQPPVASSSPSPSEATKAPVTLTVPVGKEGQNAQLVVEELEELGFENFIYNSDTGKTVLLLSNWTVTSIDGAGQQQLSSKSVVIHVTK
jgi:hypothetical protein